MDRPTCRVHVTKNDAEEVRDLNCISENHLKILFLKEKKNIFIYLSFFRPGKLENALISTRNWKPLQILIISSNRSWKVKKSIEDGKRRWKAEIWKRRRISKHRLLNCLLYCKTFIFPKCKHNQSKFWSTSSFLSGACNFMAPRLLLWKYWLSL